MECCVGPVRSGIANPKALRRHCLPTITADLEVSIGIREYVRILGKGNLGVRFGGCA